MQVDNQDLSEEQKPLFCSQCRFLFKSPKEMRAHVVAAHIEKPDAATQQGLEFTLHLTLPTRPILTHAYRASRRAEEDEEEEEETATQPTPKYGPPS